MTKLLLGCAVFAMATGCVTARVERKAAVKVVELSELNGATASADNTYICEEGNKPGSNIKTPVCQTVRQRDLDASRALDNVVIGQDQSSPAVNDAAGAFPLPGHRLFIRHAKEPPQ